MDDDDVEDDDVQVREADDVDVEGRNMMMLRKMIVEEED